MLFSAVHFCLRELALTQSCLELCAATFTPLPKTAGAAAVLKKGAQANGDELVAYCREHIAAKVPERIDIAGAAEDRDRKILKRVSRDLGTDRPRRLTRRELGEHLLGVLA